MDSLGREGVYVSFVDLDIRGDYIPEVWAVETAGAILLEQAVTCEGRDLISEG